MLMWLGTAVIVISQLRRQTESERLAQQRIQFLEAALITLANGIPAREISPDPFTQSGRGALEDLGSLVLLCTDGSQRLPAHFNVRLFQTLQLQRESSHGSLPTLGLGPTQMDSDPRAESSGQFPFLNRQLQTALDTHPPLADSADAASGSVEGIGPPLVLLGSAVAVFLAARSVNAIRLENASLREANRVLQQTLQRVESQHQRHSPSPLLPSESSLSRIFNSIPAIIAISTCADATYVDVNPAFVQALGFTREEALGRRAVDLGVWSRPEQREELISALQQGKSVHEVECQLRSKSGQTITVLTSVEPIHWNGKQCLLFCSRDITSLERAHEEREKFASLIRNSQDFIATADLQGKLSYLNPAGRRMIGIGEADPIDSISISDYLPEPWRAFHTGTALPTVLESGAWDGEMQFRNLRTQELIDVWRSIFLIVDPKTQEPICFASVTHNITERRRAEEKIRQLNLSLERRVLERTAELEALNQELEAFAYSVSHDLRAPLRHIHGYIELLTRATEGQRTEKASRYLQTITEASEEMARLIDDLLEFSRTGRVELVQIPIDLDELAHEVSTRFAPPAVERAIQWNIHSKTRAFGDPTLVRQVLANLFDNAIKYSRTRALSEVEFGSTAPEGDHATLFVRDNGVGFDMQYVHKLFGVFERLHSSTEFEGTGIGLATVRRIVSRHGGRTWAESQLDQGAIFYFTLRRAAPSQAIPATMSQP